MTSFAFILGVVPLVIAQGAGAEMRKALGVAVFSGMLGVTFFGIFLTPVFYYVIQWFAERTPGAEGGRPRGEPRTLNTAQPEGRRNAEGLTLHALFPRGARAIHAARRGAGRGQRLDAVPVGGGAPGSHPVRRISQPPPSAR